MRIRLAPAFPLVVVAAAFSGACEEPVPLIPRGAWALTFRAPSSDCAVDAHEAGVGAVADEGKLELKANGAEAEVNCEVKTAGGGYAVSGEVSFGGQFLSLSIAEIKKDATYEAPATGLVEFQTGTTAELYRSNECIFYFVKDQLVDKGKVWGSFQCPSVTGPGDSVCEIEQGYFAFENCTGTATEEEEEEE